MVHLNLERLADVALEASEPLHREELEHVRSCQECHSELEALRRTAVILRRADPVPPLAPDHRVWLRIASDIGSQHRSEMGSDLAVAEPERVEAVPAEPLPPRTVRPRRRARPRRAWVLLAAAVGLVVGIGSTVVVNLIGNRPDVVSSTPLVALPGHTGTGTAELVRTDGVTELRVEVEATAPTQEYRELWLINTDGKRMYAVGVLPPTGTGTYPIPPQLNGDLAGFTIVDVSIEPYDGNAEHSRNSLVRGTLPA